MTVIISTPAERLVWADACRVFAILAVILIHASAPVFYAKRSIPLDYFLIANILDSFARVGVPLFIMLSGSLLLRDKSKDSLHKLGGRFARIIIPLFFWSFIYFSWVSFWSTKKFSFSSATWAILQAPVMYHLEFLYTLCGVYLLLPLLKVIAKSLINDKWLSVYLLILWLIINSVTIYFPVGLIKQLKLMDCLSWSGLFIIGYYVTNSLLFKQISARFYALVYIVASLSTFFISWQLNVESLQPIETAYQYLSPNVLIGSVAAFLWTQKITIPKQLHRPLAIMSNLAFPIYCIHLLTMEFLKAGWFGFTINLYWIHPFIGILCLSLATFIISLAIVYFLRKIPQIARIIG